MPDLSTMECEACRVGAPIATQEEIDEFMPQLPEWQILDRDGVNQLERVFKFKNFAEALSFTNAVGELAEDNGHHPAILTEWGKVTVTFWTHKIKGLHISDFVMSRRTDRLYGGNS